MADCGENRRKESLMIFDDRIHAGQILADLLENEKIDFKKSLVAAIPRGGVPVAAQIARRFKLSLFPLVIKKIGAPINAELAIGATASFGRPILDRELIRDLDISSDYLKKEILKKKREAKNREFFLGVNLSKLKFGKKTIIVVDDGLATGQTAKLAAKVLRQFGAGKIILTVPCAPALVIKQLGTDYDKIICPETRDDFMAVGQFYRNFRPVEEAGVKNILDQNDAIVRTKVAKSNNQN